MQMTKPCTLSSFFESMMDPNVIQCVLDIPLAQVSLPDSLRCVLSITISYICTYNSNRNIDHGLVHGWNATTYDVPVVSKVHPENFTVKGWGLLHHAGFLTYPHHDAEGSVTWIKMEVGIKFWVIFHPKDRLNDRKHLQELAIKLGNFTHNIPWIKEHCDAELVTLYPGDMLWVIWNEYPHSLIHCLVE
jgi:hypothetical protein